MAESPKKSTFIFIGLIVAMTLILAYEMTFAMDLPFVVSMIKSNSYSVTVNRINTGLQGKAQFETRYLDLFLKQLSRAQRFERNEELSDLIGKMVTRLSHINGGHQIKYDPRKNVTIIFNAINEISNPETLLSDFKSIPPWSKSANILFGLNQTVYNKHSKTLKYIQSKLPNFKWVILHSNQTDSVVKTLKNLVTRTSTKHVMITRKLLKIDRRLNINNFLIPLAKKTSDVVSGSIFYPDGRWSSSCHQSKLIWSQYKSVFGFDVSYRQKRIRCDYFDGPFAMDRDVLLDYLTAKVRTKCADELVYPEILYVMNNQNKIMKLHLYSVFYIEPLPDFENLTRKSWLDFAVRNEISEIYGKNHLEFSHIEAKAKCGLTKTMLRQRACMRDLHFMLINTYKLFDKLGYQYTNEDGSGLAAAKLHDTLPWDLDQDFAFRTQNFTSLVKHEGEWKKLGMYFSKELNKPCVQNISLANSFTCGYIGIRDRHWRMEAF